MRLWFLATALALGAVSLSAQRNELLENEGLSPFALPAGVKVIRDVAYGRDAAQRFDVYVPQNAHSAAVIFMVHGGGWRIGDKAMRSVVENKVAHWVPRGYILISTNYRMLPAADAVEQAHAADWGGDKTKFRADGTLRRRAPHRAHRELAVESHPVARGGAPRQCRARRPSHHGVAAPSALRPRLRQRPCAVARRVTAPPVLEENLSHREINVLLGQAGSYTAAVDRFMTDRTAPAPR